MLTAPSYLMHDTACLNFSFSNFFKANGFFGFLWIQANQSIVVTRNCLEKAAAELEFLWSLGETQHEYVHKLCVSIKVTQETCLKANHALSAS